MSSEKITILGGGSPFVPSLIHAMLEDRDTFEGSEIYLMDINPDLLPLLTDFGEELSDRNGVDMEFTSTTDAEEALVDSTFVLPSYRIGGVEHMKYDIEIPTKYGISGDETTGPGGTFMAQCTIPATLKYCEMIENLCPDAWVISYVNPANAIFDAVQRESDVNFISLCDCFAGLSMMVLPKMLDMPPYERQYCVSEDIKPRAIGVNHLTWLVDLQVNGRDGYPLLRKKIREYEEKGLHDQKEMDFSFRMFETFGYLNACPSHVLPYLEQEKYLKERKETIKEEEILGWSESRMDFVKDVVKGEDYGNHPEEYAFSPHHANQVIGVMISIIEDENREWGGINFKNNGAISNLSDDAIVEGPVIVDSGGITPINMGELPKPVLGLTQSVINWEELTVDAALTGDTNVLYQALLACPYVNDMGKAEEIMVELLDVHEEYMPQFRES